MDAILSVDAGTTGVTVLVVDGSASVLSHGYREFPQHFPADGWVEHDLSQIWSATLAATREALGGSGATITGIGITNQRETVCFWDRETLGSPRRAIVWQDRRSAGICEDLRAQGHGPRIEELTGLRLDPYFSGTKLAWVRENDPQTWTHVESGRVAIGTVDSYLVSRMTRGLHHVTDHTNASRTLLYDLAAGAWSPELCDLLGVPIAALPEIVPSFGEIARSDPTSFLGLGVPIAGVAGDQQAALVGQAGFTEGAAKCTYGTGSFLLVHTGAAPARSVHGLLSTVALGHPDGRRDFALEGSVFVTGAAVQWLRDGLAIIEKASDVEALAASVPDSGGVVFVPALTGLGAPRLGSGRARADHRTHPRNDQGAHRARRARGDRLLGARCRGLDDRREWRAARAPRGRRWRGGKRPALPAPGQCASGPSSIAPRSCRPRVWVPPSSPDWAPDCGSPSRPSRPREPRPGSSSPGRATRRRTKDGARAVDRSKDWA